MEFQEIDDHSKKGSRGFRLVQLIFSFLIFVVRDRSEKRYFESISTKISPTVLRKSCNTWLECLTAHDPLESTNFIDSILQLDVMHYPLENEHIPPNLENEHHLQMKVPRPWT